MERIQTPTVIYTSILKIQIMNAVQTDITAVQQITQNKFGTTHIKAGFNRVQLSLTEAECQAFGEDIGLWGNTASWSGIPSGCWRNDVRS